MTQIVSMCMMCKRFKGRRNGDGPRCDAFDGRIPNEIMWGEFDHRHPHPDDNGLMFVPRDELAQAEVEAIYGRVAEPAGAD